VGEYIPSDLRNIIRKLVTKTNLSETEARYSMDQILGGRASEAAIASFLISLRMKGETPEELSAILQSIKSKAITITPKVSGSLVDTCGTGGDAIGSFNISTAAAIIACASGCKVAKHGNRSASGMCGSADFLEYVGMNLDTCTDIVQEAIENIGIGFLYAPKFHPAILQVASTRKSIGVRTAFNLVGPLCNPCTNLTGQLIGVCEPSLVDKLSAVMRTSGASNIMIAHSSDGFDELSNTCENRITWILNGEINRIIIHPKDIGMSIAKSENLLVNSGEDSIRHTLRVIYGLGDSAKEDIALLNASAALVIGDIAVDLQEGVQIARQSVREGTPREKLYELIKRCGDLDKLSRAEDKFLAP
jgi:anthranilate phosphoribosyltransferase